MKDKRPNYKIVYYSGTGGTEMVANCFDETLKEYGCQGDTETITEGAHHKYSSHDILFLLFPVHAFNAPEAVYRWIEQTERVVNIPAVVISISGGGEISPNTSSRRSTIKRLEKKGYEVVYEGMLVMPCNFAIATKEPLSIMLLEVLPDKVKRITNEILSDIKRRTKPFPIDLIFSLLGELEKPAARFFGKRIKVSDECNGCGFCSSHCPAGNITMLKSRPIFDHKCHLCLKCIYACPRKALIPSVGKFIIIKDGYDLKKMEKQVPLTEAVNVNKTAKGFLWKGLKKYLLES